MTYSSLLDLMLTFSYSPGWVWTGMTGANDPNKTKPPGAWTPEQTVEYMFEKVLVDDDFYIICPDNETSSVSGVGH